jgi:sedoheptulokinase
MITVGLDAGTTTISGVVYDCATRSVLKTRTLPNKGQINTAASWQNLQDAAIIWDTCQSLLDGFLKEYPDIAGIGLTGQMHGIVYVDKNGQAISPLATWQDGRGDKPYQNGNTYVDHLINKSDHHMATGFGLTTYFYDLQNGLLPDGTASLCTIADYIGIRLTRRKRPLLHASNAHGLGLFDLEQMQFDEEAVDKAGIDPEILPGVAQGETGIGETASGIPVWTAIGDNQASFLGAACNDYDVVANIGTSSQLSVRSKSLVTAEGLDIRPYVNGEYILVGAGLCGGSAYALLHGLLQEVLEMYGLDGRDKLYEKMEQAAGRVKDDENLLEIDTRFRGSRIKPEIRGAITLIGIDNFSVGHLAQGVMRGIVNELYEFYLQVPINLRTTEVMVGGGNALRHNTTLRALLAEQFGMDLIISPHIEEGAVGASMLACQ